MLKQLHHHQNGPGFSSSPILLSSSHSPFFSNKKFISCQCAKIATNKSRLSKNVGGVRLLFNITRASVGSKKEKTFTVKAVITAKITLTGLLSNLTLNAGLDAVTDFVGKALLLELVSCQLDPETGSEKTIKGYGHKENKDGNVITLESSFDVPESFGDLGAVLVENQYRKEIYLQDILLNGYSNGPVSITCKSWISSKFENPQKRIFFTNKSYLPLETPSGLKNLRKEELVNLRGNGTGERKSSDRIYDYDKYNDLAFSDLSDELARPVLGGAERPYPRRCRTGRGPSEKDPLSEKKSLLVYVPRDEAFLDEKELQFTATTAEQILDALVPSVPTALVDINLGFPNFTAIDNIFNQRFELPMLQNQGDDEFARQTLAGLNPFSIQLITEWPLKSKLDPKIYGQCDCAITKELIEEEIKGIMTLEEALQRKKLFVIDYHDLLLPYVKKVRAIEGTTLYGSRTIFFLTNDSTLRPIAIELTRPPMDDKPQWKKVFTPGYNSTASWLWKFAKVHVSAHDTGYHELIVHWLRTHCCLEPYIIATHRQLSTMHPIYRLLHPHLRYTMSINARARMYLISASGIIETCFSLARYSMELSATAYDQIWRFDMEALPEDLVRRGMAVKDSTAPHGLKLTIQDYPFANDGLLVWDAIKTWISDYVHHYYQEPRLIATDTELQTWWTEIRTIGHEDKKDEPWWPKLSTPDDLIQILTTIVWVASCHHAAVDFGQYTYGGYFPNKTWIARTNMPTEDPTTEGNKKFLEKPESVLMECFPSQIQATLIMAILRLLSTHSGDEEYLGGQIEPSWSEDQVIKSAFERFKRKLIHVEGVIDARNSDPGLLNRTGAGVVPYQLLKPFSKPGMTGMGVPNSTSI